MLPAHEYGRFGGRVLRPFKADVPFIADAEVTAEQAMKWPIQNRKALFELGKVEWYGPPEDGEKRLTAANAAKPPVKKETKKAEAKTPPAVRKSSRTK